MRPPTNSRPAPKIPREYFGQARMFCERIDSATKVLRTALLDLTSGARAIARHRTSWRSEHLPGFERQWRGTVPPEGRLSLQIQRSKRELMIDEVRVSRSLYEDDRWSKPQFAASVV